MDRAYMKTVEEVLEHFQVKEEDGLSVDDVEKLREKYGPNGRKMTDVHADCFQVSLTFPHTHLPLASLSPPPLDAFSLHPYSCLCPAILLHNCPQPLLVCLPQPSWEGC